MIFVVGSIGFCRLLCSVFLLSVPALLLVPGPLRLIFPVFAEPSGFLRLFLQFLFVGAEFFMRFLLSFLHGGLLLPVELSLQDLDDALLFLQVHLCGKKFTLDGAYIFIVFCLKSRQMW